MRVLTDEEADRINELAQRMLEVARKQSVNQGELCHACVILLHTCGADSQAVTEALKDLENIGSPNQRSSNQRLN